MSEVKSHKLYRMHVKKSRILITKRADEMQLELAIDACSHSQGVRDHFLNKVKDYREEADARRTPARRQ